jgi:hypothetical protein
MCLCNEEMRQGLKQGTPACFLSKLSNSDKFSLQSQFLFHKEHFASYPVVIRAFFLICIVGGGIKVHLTLRPLNDLLCQPRVIMILEKSVE